MPISMYDQPAQAQFMQTYTPMPFQEMMQAGQMKQQRWDVNEQMTQQASTLLGELPALNQVMTAEGKAFEVGDAKSVEKKAEEYSTMIGDLTSSIEDKSSPEYKNKLTEIVTSLRKDMGQRGIFGQAAGNVEKYKQIEEQIREAELGGKTYRAIALSKQLEDFAGRSQEGITGLDARANILPDIDINKKLNETMSKIGDAILADPVLSKEFAGSIGVTGYAEGISGERAAVIAQRLITQDPEIMADINAQVIQQGGGEEEVAQAVNNIATTMGEVYRSEDKTFSLRKDDLFFRGLDKSDALQDQLFAAKVNLPYPASQGVRSADELDTVLSEYDTNITETRLTARDNLSRLYDNITPDDVITNEDGTIGIREDVKIGVDIGAELNRYNQQIAQTKRNKKQALRLKQDALKDSKLTPEYLESPQFKESVSKARRLAENEFNSIAVNPASEDAMQEAYGSRNTKENYIAENYEKFIDEVDPRYAAFNDYIQAAGKGDKTQQVNVVNTPKPVNEYMTKYFEGFTNSMPLTWADTQKGAETLTASERQGLEDDPLFLGFFYDQETGDIGSLYNVKDSSGDNYTVKSNTPEGVTAYLHENGMFDYFDSLIQNKLFNELDGLEGAEGYGVGTLTLPSGKLDEKNQAIDPLQLNYRGQSPVDNLYRVEIESEDSDEPTVLPFSSIQQMVTSLNQIAKKSHENALRERQEKKSN